MSRRAMMVKTGGGGGGFSMLSLSPWIWLKAGTGFYTDLGSTPCTTTGDLIEQWSDQSGNARHATQTTSGNRPTYDATGFNGLAASNYAAASSQFLSFPSMASLSKVSAFIAVKALADPSAGHNGAGLWKIGGGSAWDTSYPFSDGIIYDDAIKATGSTIAGPGLTLDSIHVYHVAGGVDGSTVTTYYLNNVSKFSNNGGAGTLPSSPRIGSSRTPFFFSGKIAEFVLFTSVLSSTDRGNVVTDIRTRLGF